MGKYKIEIATTFIVLHLVKCNILVLQTWSGIKVQSCFPL